MLVAPVGAALGALIGSMVAPGEKWESVPLDNVFAHMARPSGTGMELALRFRF